MKGGPRDEHWRGSGRQVLGAPVEGGSVPFGGAFSKAVLSRRQCGLRRPTASDAGGAAAPVVLVVLLLVVMVAGAT